MGRRRVDLQEAAQLLGISSDAVRKRAKRGNMPYETGADGKLYVWVDTGRTGADAPGEENRHNITVSDPRDELIATLKEQLEAERNAHAETRRIAYTLAQRVPELEAAQEPRESPPEAAEPTERVETPAAATEAQTAPQRRSWWRRFFGFE